MKKNNLISIVVPVFNESENIIRLFEEIDLLFSKISYNYELIYINDGSNDDSAEILSQLSSKHSFIKVVHFTRNFGQQAALIAGINYVKGDAIITMDCDGQDPVSLIEDMILEWRSGVPVVYARRVKRNDSFFKKLTAKLYYRLLNLISEIKIPNDVGEYRLIDSSVVSNLQKASIHTGYLRGMIAWLGYKQAFVDFERPKREFGKTGFSIYKMLRLAMNGILNFSLAPLRIGLFLGMFSIFTGVIFLFYLMINFLFFDQFYKLLEWLVVVIYIFVGFLFVLIWIVSEFIGKVYKSQAGMSSYVIGNVENI